MANASIPAALATSCRMLSNSERVQLADKKEVLEFHLLWLSLCVPLPQFGTRGRTERGYATAI
jgi:hypothetical protein